MQMSPTSQRRVVTEGILEHESPCLEPAMSQRASSDPQTVKDHQVTLAVTDLLYGTLAQIPGCNYQKLTSILLKYKAYHCWSAFHNRVVSSKLI